MADNRITIFELVAKVSNIEDSSNRALLRKLYEVTKECLSVSEKYIDTKDETYKKVMNANKEVYNIVVRPDILSWMCLDIKSGNTISGVADITDKDKELFKKYIQPEYTNSKLDSLRDGNTGINNSEIMKLVQFQRKTYDDLKSNEPEKIEDDVDDLEVIKEEWEGKVKLETKKIMTVYEKLFKSGMEIDVPKGVLTSFGYYTYVKGEIVAKKDPVLAPLYSIIKGMVGSELEEAGIDEKINLNSMTNGKTYFTRLQVKNVYGLVEYLNKDKETKDVRYKNWKEFSSNVTKNVENIMYQVIKQACAIGKENIDKYLEMTRKGLTTCIVLSEYDVSSCCKLKVYINNREINGNTIEKAIKSNQNALFSGVGELQMCKATAGVYTVNIMFDSKAAGLRPLFAYQAINVLLDRGEKPSWSNIILGRNVRTDTIYTLNFYENTKFNTMIGAAQRAGKGVMTLNILSTAYAEDFPVFYLDGKPEMGRMLWDLGDKYNVPVLSVDAFVPKDGYQFSGGMETGIAGSDIIGGVIAYLKTLQLAIVIGSLRSAQINFDVSGFNSMQDRVVFVVDEALALTKAIASVRNILTSLGKDKDTPENIKTYAKSVRRWLDGLHNSMGSALLSTLPNAKMNFFWLGQSMDAASWKVENFDVLSQAVRSKNITKLMGNGMIEQYFGLPRAEKGSVLAENINSEQRCFGYYCNALPPKDEDKIEVFKPYLVLPSIDENSKIGADAVSNFKYMDDSVIGFAKNDDGTFKDEVGFEGIVAKLCGDANSMGEKLRKSYDIAYKILDMAGLLGKYSSSYETAVFNYLYDCSLDSLVSDDDIKRRIQGGTGDNDGSLDMEYNEDIEPNKVIDLNSTIDLDTPMDRPFNIMEEMSKGTGDFDVYEPDSDYEEQAEDTLDDNNDDIEEEKPGAYDKVIEAINDVYNNRGDRNKDLDAESIARIEEVLRNLRQVDPKVKTDKKGFIYSNEGRVIPKNKVIDCSSSCRVRLSWVEKALSMTPGGCGVYIDRLWKNVLEDVCAHGNGGIKKELITQVGLYSGNLFVNGKIVNLNGVVGGDNCTRLTDIVRFKQLFRKFGNIKELYLDGSMLSELIGEYGTDDLAAVFADARNLRVIQVIDGSHRSIMKREDFISRRMTNDIIDRSSTKAKMQQMEYEYSKKSLLKSWQNNTQGKKAWGSKMASRSFNAAGNSLKGKNKSLAKSALLATTGVTIGAIGAVAWVGWYGAKTLRGLWKRY